MPHPAHLAQPQQFWLLDHPGGLPARRRRPRIAWASMPVSGGNYQAVIGFGVVLNIAALVVVAVARSHGEAPE
ncbi:MAG: hypothetical protein ACRDQV_14715 [Pseudonocardiaceae bacterium]